MEPITESQVDLFAENLPSMDQIRQLAEHVHSSEIDKLEFADQLESNLPKTSPQAALSSGIGLHILGRYAEAAEKLNKSADTKEKYIYLACALRKTGDFKSAIDALDKSLKYDADSLTVTLEKASTHRQAGDLDACEKELSSCTNFKNVNAEYHYQLARLHEARGLYSKACNDYKAAIELSSDHQRALFHLAFCCDLGGDEQAAIDYYQQIVANHPVYVNAMLNLAVLHEDAGEFEKASNYISKVLQAHPNHPRARLFQKDIDSSKTMFYDEEKEMKRTRKTQILETPISDFELSVRSRNCLKKMNIYTIGDLLNITESELLSYKNFGETSLREIKIILDSKGLYLGMDLEQKHSLPSDLSEHHTPEDEGLLSKPVEDLQLSVRARKCLQRLNLRAIGELTQKTEAELLGCKNFGVTSLNEIKKALTTMGLALRNLD